MWNKRNKTRHLCLLANLDLYILFYLIFFFFYSSPKFILTFTFSFFLLACLYQHLSLSGHFYLIAATKSCSVTTTIAKVNLIFHQQRKTISKWKKCQNCRWFTSILMNQHTKSQPKLLNRRRKAHTYTYIWTFYFKMAC